MDITQRAQQPRSLRERALAQPIKPIRPSGIHARITTTSRPPFEARNARLARNACISCSARLARLACNACISCLACLARLAYFIKSNADAYPSGQRLGRKLENFRAAVALHFTYCNFIDTHSAIRMTMDSAQTAVQIQIVKDMKTGYSK